MQLHFTVSLKKVTYTYQFHELQHHDARSLVQLKLSVLLPHDQLVSNICSIWIETLYTEINKSLMELSINTWIATNI